MPDGFVAQPPPSLTRLLRLLPAKMRGKSRLARLLLGSRLTQGPFLIEGAAGSKFLLPNAEETVGFHMLISGIYEPDRLKSQPRIRVGLLWSRQTLPDDLARLEEQP